MARFLIQWCAPDATHKEVHPHTGGGALMVEAYNLATVQKHTYPWTTGLGVTATIMPGLSDEEYV